MINVISLFSGGGGLDLGFVYEGFNILWAIDNNKNAFETYKENFGNHIVFGDINKIDINTIPTADVIIGGPPCQSFSLAGNRNAEDPRGKLVWKYLEILSKIQPKAFLFENVTGLLSAKDKNGEKILPQLQKAFYDIGYTISTSVLNAADYGVPQRRKRVIIVGLKDSRHFAFPEATHSEKADESRNLKKYVNVKEALDDLPHASLKDDAILEYKTLPQNDYQRIMRLNCFNVTEHCVPKMSELDKFICHHVKPGGNYMDIPTNVKSERIKRLQRDGGHTTCYGRMNPDEPSYTINTYFNRPNVGCNIHYCEDRLITVREALRLQSFPDNFKIVSSSKQGKNLIIGNAVPPILGRVLANRLKQYLEDK